MLLMMYNVSISCNWGYKNIPKTAADHSCLSYKPLALGSRWIRIWYGVSIALGLSTIFPRDLGSHWTCINFATPTRTQCNVEYTKMSFALPNAM